MLAKGHSMKEIAYVLEIAPTHWSPGPTKELVDTASFAASQNLFPGTDPTWRAVPA
jgi:hypothetical protein